jgi:hypothetical protein
MTLIEWGVTPTPTGFYPTVWVDGEGLMDMEWEDLDSADYRAYVLAGLFAEDYTHVSIKRKA